MIGKIVALVAGVAAGYALMSTMSGAQPQQNKEKARVIKSGPFAGFATSSPERPDKLVLSLEEWKKRLTPEQFRILRNQGTEPAFCGLLNDNKEAGTYHCTGCDLPLFSSDSKFQSGTGWPSFFQPISKDAIWLKEDRAYGMIREETLCSRCDGHLGHVFEDGPEPTGLRFCMNSEALKFVKKKE
jgi:methionine-R-sulfoxide reductase